MELDQDRCLGTSPWTNGIELPEMLLGTGWRVASLTARDAEGRRTHATSGTLRSERWGSRPGRRCSATGVTRLTGALPPLARRWHGSLRTDGPGCKGQRRMQRRTVGAGVRLTAGSPAE